MNYYLDCNIHNTYYEAGHYAYEFVHKCNQDIRISFSITLITIIIL